MTDKVTSQTGRLEDIRSVGRAGQGGGSRVRVDTAEEEEPGAMLGSPSPEQPGSRKWLIGSRGGQKGTEA